MWAKGVRFLVSPLQGLFIGPLQSRLIPQALAVYWQLLTAEHTKIRTTTANGKKIK